MRQLFIIDVPLSTVGTIDSETHEDLEMVEITMDKTQAGNVYRQLHQVFGSERPAVVRMPALPRQGEDYEEQYEQDWANDDAGAKPIPGTKRRMHPEEAAAAMQALGSRMQQSPGAGHMPPGFHGSSDIGSRTVD